MVFDGRFSITEDRQRWNRSSSGNWLPITRGSSLTSWNCFWNENRQWIGFGMADWCPASASILVTWLLRILRYEWWPFSCSNEVIFIVLCTSERSLWWLMIGKLLFLVRNRIRGSAIRVSCFPSPAVDMSLILAALATRKLVTTSVYRLGIKHRCSTIQNCALVTAHPEFSTT
jgi:hypothetical protein